MQELGHIGGETCWGVLLLAHGFGHPVDFELLLDLLLLSIAVSFGSSTSSWPSSSRKLLQITCSLFKISVKTGCE